MKCSTPGLLIKEPGTLIESVNNKKQKRITTVTVYFFKFKKKIFFVFFIETKSI